MTHRLLFIKPPDRFLENEFVYQQLGPHYLQSFLLENGIESDLLVLYERPEARKARLVLSKAPLQARDRRSAAET